MEAFLKTPSGSTIPIVAPSSSDRASFTVGRQAATADLRVPHKSISRQHATLDYSYHDDDDSKESNQQQSTATQRTRQLILRDLGGKHGTMVNQQRVPAHQAVVLKHGDCLQFGNDTDVYRVELITTKEEPTSSLGTSTTTTAAMTATAVTQLPFKTSVEAVDESNGLTGRAKRQAEIAAMMASLEEAPTYTVYKQEEEETTVAVSSSLDNDPTASQQDKSNDSSMQLTEQEQQNIATKFRLPVTQTFMMENETDRHNAVMALAVDPSGSRFVVGTTDNRLRFYDFSGMDHGRRDSFRSIVPEDGHWAVSCAYSNTGDRILVGTTSVQPVVLDREGHEVVQFVRGDMYVTDQTKTIGHTAGVSAVDWHPFERDVVLTASLDGSARLWNLQGRTQFKKLVCDKVVSAKNVKGQRTTVTACAFHPSGREFALGTSCGSVLIWNPSRASGRPERAVFGESGAIAALAYNVDGTKLASRSVQDDQVRVWNAKRLSRSSVPLVTCRDAGSTHEHANVAFSPDGTILCLGVSEARMIIHGNNNNKRQELGRLHFYNVSGEADGDSVDPLLSLDTPTNCSPIIVKWHTRINQIFVGCSDGRTFILYDPKLSTKGALVAASRMGRSVDDLSLLLKSRAPTGSAGVSGDIVTPFSLPMYREEIVSAKKRKREERKDPVKSHEPERPATGKHKTGGHAGGLNFAQFVADQTMTKSKSIAGKDPREALFKYNEGESFVERAYKGNKSKLAEKTAEQEEEEQTSSKK